MQLALPVQTRVQQRLEKWLQQHWRLQAVQRNRRPKQLAELLEALQLRAVKAQGKSVKGLPQQ